jgi:hypothetical protein
MNGESAATEKACYQKKEEGKHHGFFIGRDT